MATRVLLPDAGTVPSSNVVRSLRAAGDFVIVGCSSDRFLLKKVDSDRKYLVPEMSDPRFVDALVEIVRRERVDLVIPTSDAEVWTIGHVRDRMPGATFLPRTAALRACRDKYELTERLRSRGVAAPLTLPVTREDSLDALFERLGGAPLWCRLRTGSAGRGASFVRSPAEAHDWLRVWKDHGVPATEFTLSAYLPGRDYACQSLWNDGELVHVKAYERLSHLPGPVHPGAVATLSALAKTTSDRRVVDAGLAAVRAIDERPTGVFGVDLRGDARGVPAVTEINAGRMYATTNLLDLTGAFSMMAIYVELALGHPVRLETPYDLSDDYYIVRSVDAPAAVFHADELFDGIDVAPEATVPTPISEGRTSCPRRSAGGRATRRRSSTAKTV